MDTEVFEKRAENSLDRACRSFATARIRGRISLRTRYIITVIVLAPFPNIAMHVVKPEHVGLLLADWMCRVFAVRIVPSHAAQIGLGVTAIISASRPRAARVLPFCFRRQAH